MREDMFKIIVERPRRGWRSAPRCRGRLAGEDDLPAKIGVRRHVAVTRLKSRWLNENLAPLKRYLGRRIGRRWDDVYAEISATLDPGHTVKQHVRQHIDDFVARIAVGRGGEWIAHRRHWLIAKAQWRQPYYVDPDDGVLKDSAALWKRLGIDPQPWRRKPAEPDPDIRKLDDRRELRRIDGLWYEIGFGSDPERWAYDLVERRPVPPGDRHAASKRQLSRAALTALGISNQLRN